jgi:F0F1-type ATP synthase delta subunit
LPRVLVTVPDERRLTAIREIVADLGPMAQRLVSVTLQNQAVEYLAEILHA